MERARGRVGDERGFMMVALLVLMAVMAVAMTAALPAWSTLSRREREAELVFRGEQYARAITLFQRKYGGSFPPNIDVLVTERFLRKKYKDPITNDDFQPIGVGEGTSLPTAPGRGGTAGGASGATGSAQRQQGGVQPGAPQQGAQQGGPRTTGIASSTAGRAATGTITTPAGRAGGVGAAGASAGIMGVTSKSKDRSLRLYNGRDHYNEWIFIATQASTQAGGRGAQAPGQGVRGGAPPGGPGTRGNPRGGGPSPSPFGLPGGQQGPRGTGPGGGGGRGRF